MKQIRTTTYAASHAGNYAGTRPHGFTLIEVLVALVIMAIMAVMSWQGIDGIVRSRDISQGKLEKTLRLNTVLAQWDQDFAAIQSTDVIESLRCDGSTVRLTRRAQDGLQVVAWSLRPAGNNESTWVRWASPVTTQVNALEESWFHSMSLQDNEPGSLRTLTGLSTWQVYFFQGNNWANCQSSGDKAEATVSAEGASGVQTSFSTTQPKGVRVVLSFAPSSGLSGSLTRDTQLGP
jgi:general secretion pathway protein J